jgi:hypothetical protein
MNWKKLCSTALSMMGAILLFTSTSSAQTPQIVAVGSSGVFTTVVISMISGDPITGTTTTCGTHVWTAGSSIAMGVDARNGSIPLEGGNIAVVWDIDSAPTTVCAYLSVDSVVGQRLFLGQAVSGNATLQLTSAALTAAGANKVSFVTDTATTGLPSAVYTAVNGHHFNVAFTDIRPEDGQFAYGRAACTRSGVTDVSCFGYGPLGGIGTAIQSSYSQTSAQVVAYSISGTDPFTGLTIPAFTTINLGATPVIVFYNTTDTATGGLGNLLPTSITSSTASAIWSGLIGLNDELVGFSTGTSKVLHVVQREPVSGTYNTFEWQMVHSRDNHGGDYSQEYNFGPTPSSCFTPPSTATFVPPTVSCANPMNVTGSQGSTFGGLRTRAIGTGEMVNAVNSANNPNSIGYAFWGLGTFGGKANIKYLAVDGADPLYASYSNGAFPSCTGAFNLGTFSCSGALPTFANLRNGGYRVWSTIRAVIYQSYTPPSSGPSVNALIQATQDQAHTNIPDLVPSIYCANSSCSSTVDGLPVFRSHYPVSGKQANNGVTSASSGFCASDQSSPNCIEEGGDMAGKPFFDIQDQEFFSLTGNEFLTWIQ